MKLKFSKWDILPVAGVLGLAVAVFLLFLPAKNPGKTLEIYENGKLLTTLSLAEDATYTVRGAYTNVVTVKAGKVAVTHTDCPGGDCQKIGWTDSAGKSIVCLPNGVEVRILGDSDVDIVVR